MSSLRARVWVALGNAVVNGYRAEAYAWPVAQTAADLCEKDADIEGELLDEVAVLVEEWRTLNTPKIAPL